jgi:hypothetical protein
VGRRASLDVIKKRKALALAGNLILTVQLCSLYASEDTGSAIWVSFMCLYLYLYFNSIDPYWLPKPSDIKHITYAYISSKHRTSHLTTTFMKKHICT